MKTLWRWLSLLLLVAWAFAYAMFQGGFVSWFLFSVMAALGFYEVLTALLISLPVGMEWEVKRRKLESGDGLQAQLKLRRRFYFPLAWLIIEAVLTKDQHIEPQKEMHVGWVGRSLAVRFHWNDLARGCYRLRPAVLTAGDLFGFCERQKRLKGAAMEIVVLPRVYPVYGWVMVSDDGEGAGAGRQTVLQTTAISGVRPYMPGDRLNQIHWKQSSRGAGLKSKLSEGDSFPGIHLLLMQDRSLYPDEAVFEWTVEVTASLIASARQRQKPIFLHLQSERFAVAHQEALMEVLAGARLTETDGRYAADFWERSAAAADASVVIVSPRLTADAGVEAFRRAGYDQIEWINVSATQPEEEMARLRRSGVWVSVARKESGGIRIMTEG